MAANHAVFDPEVFDPANHAVFNPVEQAIKKYIQSKNYYDKCNGKKCNFKICEI